MLKSLITSFIQKSNLFNKNFNTKNTISKLLKVKKFNKITIFKHKKDNISRVMAFTLRWRW